MSDLAWTSRRLPLDTTALQLLEGDKRAIVMYPVKHGAVRFMAVDEDSGETHVALVTQPESVVTLIRLLQKEDESKENFEDRVSLYLLQAMYMISRTPDLIPLRFTLAQSDRFQQKDSERLGVYVQVLCDSRH